MTKKQKRKFLIKMFSIIIIMLLILSIVYLVMNRDLLKSDKTRFIEGFSKNIDSIQVIKKAFAKTEYDNMKNNNTFIENLEIKINDFQNMGTTQENTDNDINKLKLEIQENVQESYKKKNIVLKQQDDDVINITTMKNDEIEGIKFLGLFDEQYILVENGKYEQLFEQIGYSEDEILKLKDVLNPFIKGINIDFELSDNEKEEIAKKYSKIINEQILNENISKQKNVNITINKNELTVDSYILKMPTEQINNIYIKLLENLKQDESILAKFEQMNMKEKFIDKIDNILEEISRNNIGMDENIIEVYEYEDRTVRTVIKGVDYEIQLDFLEMDNEKFIQYIQKENETEIQKVTLDIVGNKTKIDFVNNKQAKPVNISIIRNKEINENKVKEETYFKYEKDNRKVEGTIDKKIEKKEEIETEKMDKEKYIEFDKLEEEKKQEILNNLKQSVELKREKYKNDINIEEIKNVFSFIGLTPDAELLNSEGVSEIEKNRFNSKFEILKGENVDSPYIINVINIIKDNLIKLEVVSNEKLKMEIDRNKSNEETVETITNFIEKQKNTKYNVEIEYDEKSGLAKYIVLTIVNKSK